MCAEGLTSKGRVICICSHVTLYVSLLHVSAFPRSRVQSTDPSSALVSTQAQLQGALHDVANALTVVLGWLEVAQRSGQCDELAKRALGLAQERAVHGQIIARSAIGAGCVDPMIDHVSRLCRNALLGVEPAACARQVRLNMVIDDGSGAVQVH